MKNLFLKLICTVILFFAGSKVNATVRIITFHYNLPYLLELQHKTLKKFIVDDYELIVLNDARDPAIELEIESICDKYGFMCVRFKPEWHDWNYHLNSNIRESLEKNPHVITDLKSPSLRHTRIIRYALEEFGYTHDDIVVILDGDAFPIRTMSLEQILKDRDIIGTLRGGQYCDYLMPVFVAFDPRKLANPSDFQMHWDIVHGIEQDTGAYSYYYMLEHPEVKLTKIPFLRGDELSKLSKDDFKKRDLGKREISLVNKLRGYYYEVHMDWHIFHFKGSSHRSIRPERNEKVLSYLNEILNKANPPLREIREYPDLKAPFPGDD